MFDQDGLRACEARCTQENPPACRSLCPFDLDIRSFMAHCAKGRLSEARGLLERHLPLPLLLPLLCDHPCEHVCLRNDLGGSLAINLLERSVCHLSESQKRLLPVPPKRQRMAVLGSGLAGLAAAWDLARKSYPVTVFSRGDPGASILERDRGNAELRKALEKTLADLSSKKVVFSCEDLVELSEFQTRFDALLVDCEAWDEPSEGMEAVCPEILLWRDNICVAGRKQNSPAGRLLPTVSQAAYEGRCAAQTMERLATGRSLTAERERKKGKLWTDVAGILPCPRVEAASHDGLYNKDELMREAERCLFCECRICVKHCAFMQKNNGYPRVFARQIYNNAAIVKGLHTGNALINGCTLCGRCEALCPDSFSMAELCRTAREDMVERGLMPPSAFEFALEDMESASTESAFVLSDPQVAGGGHDYLLFPGCQLVATHTPHLKLLWTGLSSLLHQKNKTLALHVSCCGAPARWAGEKKLFLRQQERLRQNWEELGKPVVITACASCLEALGGNPWQMISLWELLDGLAEEELFTLCGFASKKAKPGTFSIHDPCSARNNPSWQSAVRSLASKVGAQWEEPALSREKTSCCGYGGLVWCSQPETAQAISRMRIEDFSHPALVSCSMCWERFEREGWAAQHLLDLLMPELGRGRVGRGCSLSQRREARHSLKAHLMGEKSGDDRLEVPLLPLRPDLLAELDEKHILLDDVRETLGAVEKSGSYFLNTENGHRVGASRPRRVTFWVEYERREDGFLLHDAWCHRMIAPGSTGEDPLASVRMFQSSTEEIRQRA